MEPTRYRECLVADFQRLRAVAAAADLAAAVPSCPQWRLRDLLEHVAEVYLHKAASMRLGKFPDPWPPDFSGEQPLALFDRAHRELLVEFDSRPVDAPAAHWYQPDQTVGCLLRRMAQETVIHRVDGELAAGREVAAIPVDLAIDGIDEMLVQFLGYQSQQWPQAFTDLPTDGAEPPVLVRVGVRDWSVTSGPKGVTVGDSPGEPVASVAADDPQALLLWLWGRAEDPRVELSGDRAELTRLRGLLREAAQ